MNVVAIIQARMGSSRLPGKSLLELAGKPVIQWVHERAAAIPGVHQVIVATTVSALDDPLAAFCEARGIRVHRGSEQDVLERYVGAAAATRADIVLRITGDCPLLDPVESGKVLRHLLASPQVDYVSNVDPPFLPDGLDTEAIRVSALNRAARDAVDSVSREHVTWFIRKHPEQFTLASIREEPDRSAIRLTLDQREDFEVLQAVTVELRRRGQFGHLPEVLEILREHPEWARLNAGIERNEGLSRALARQKERDGHE